MTQELIVNANEKRRIVLVHNTPECEERTIRLVGEGAEVFVDEIFLYSENLHKESSCADFRCPENHNIESSKCGDFHGDNISSNLVIVHDARRTTSRVNCRGVVDKDKKVFANAKIVIPKHAQLSDSFVSQKFMLLDKTAKAEAIPSLEIEANEVKASHSAIIAPLDYEKIFYMMSKGLSYKDACLLLVEGFLQIPEEYKQLWQVSK